MSMEHTDSIAFVIYLFVFLFGVQTAIVDIYEFVLFKDYGNTNRFKRAYRKRHLLKRYFLLTIFDKELIDVCNHKTILKKIFVADVIYWIIGLIMITSRVWLIIIKNEQYTIIYWCYALLLIIFYLWYLNHSIRWDEWIKGNWRSGQREFRILLPDERKKKRNKKK